MSNIFCPRTKGHNPYNSNYEYNLVGKAIRLWIWIWRIEFQNITPEWYQISHLNNKNRCKKQLRPSHDHRQAKNTPLGMKSTLAVIVCTCCNPFSNNDATCTLVNDCVSSLNRSYQSQLTVAPLSIFKF